MSRVLLLTQVLPTACIVVAEIVAGIGLAYHYVLLLAGTRRRRATPAKTDSPSLRFAVALPAHNEEGVIGATVARLLHSDYPRDCFDVHVVADYCNDGTAAKARDAGAVVHERRDGPQGRKGYALAWLLERLLRDATRYEAFVIFDADSRVAPDFLSHANRMLVSGAQAAQGRHVIANPSASRFSALADADMRLNNRLRNQAKENLGLSARLMGDGMCFRREVLERYPWSRATSLTEDREYGLYLATQGVRVRYLPEAVSCGEAAMRWRDAGSQRLRWHGGVFEMQRRWLRPLLAAAWRKRNPAAFDLALELLLPPFSLLALASAASAVAGGVLTLLLPRALPVFLAGAALTAAAVCLPVLGLLSEGAPASTLQALALGPFYALWRALIAARVELKRGRVKWVRTPRSDTTQDS